MKPTARYPTSDGAGGGMGEIPGTLRAVVRGSLIGVVVALTGISGSLYLSGHGAGVALGIGGMAAFWGGLGFGSMLGGTLHLIRHSGEPYGHMTELREVTSVAGAVAETPALSRSGPVAPQRLSTPGATSKTRRGRPRPTAGALSSTTRPAARSLARCCRIALWLRPIRSVSSAMSTGRPAFATWLKIACRVGSPSARASCWRLTGPDVTSGRVPDFFYSALEVAIQMPGGR